MGNDELLNYISMFREKAEQGKLVIFVGAGVSCNVDGMPSWNALIQNMAKAIDYSRCDTCRHRLESCENTCLLKDDFSTDELLKVPQHVFNKDQELYYRILNESIPAVTADAPLSSAIFDINPAHIITTNYDQLLESSKNIFCEQYQVIVYDKDLTGAFDPETWNAKPSVALGSTIITMPDKSTVDLGHFDTAEEATQAVKKYLAQQVKAELLTQAEADKILSNAAVE